jgi:hypothetical protein
LRSNWRQPRIELIRNAEVIVPDVLEERKVSSKKYYARYNDAHLDSERPKPLQRVTMNIPCPKTDCAPSADHGWICTRCSGLIEYGHIDDFLYYDYSRREYKWWGFRYSNTQHGLNFYTYEEPKLLQRLKALEPFEELNILILGTTGVGKST